MKRGLTSRYADVLASRSRLIIALLLVVSAVVGAGAVLGTTGEEQIGQASIDSTEQAALDRIEATYETDDAVVAQVVVRDEGGDVLTRESLLESLRLQQAFRKNESINATLRDGTGTVGIENVVANVAYAHEQREHAKTSGTNGNSGSNTSAAGRGQSSEPTLSQQIAAVESSSDEEIETYLSRILDPDASVPGSDPTEFLPTDYEPGTTSADARTTLVFQKSPSSSATTTQTVNDAQVTINSLVEKRFADAFVFGQGIIDEESSQAIGDTFIIITPVAVVLLLVVLTIAYRDLVDVLVSVFGVGIVMVWYAGVQGWLGIPSNSTLIAVPFLLIGLSIDYSLHVVMRYREAREGTLDTDGESVGRRDPATAMRLGIAGVVLALATAAFSTAVGFFSNYISPLGSIQDFAILSGVGIVAIFVVFAALVPAVKLELEQFFDRRGRDRRNPAVGVSSGWLNRLLSGTASLARRAPIVVIVISLLLASAGAYGATGIDTEFNQADFLPQEAPTWMESLPEPFAPGDYDISENLDYLSDNFRQRGQGSAGQVLIRGNVTAPALLTAVNDVSHNTDSSGTIVVGSDGRAAIEGPVSVLRTVAAENQTVANAIETRDTDGDGLPDKDVATVYDLLFDAAPEQASSVLYRTDNGSYQSARLTVGVQGNASAQSVASDVRGVSSAIEGDAPVRATATGGPVITAVVQGALFETLVEGFAITLGVILTLLIGLYWWRHRAPGLGVVTLVPVLIALAWLLGTMAALDIPFNSETVVITSLAIGLGVDYSIHASERFVDERARSDSLADSLSRALTGTGGALLGSAVTTAAGFGVLALALSPPLQRFGIVTGLSIIYAFVACVTVLPCLLVIRERLLTRIA
ncbi:rnd superfamily exporter [Halogeometricum borinquense DSM 11551]|uniref:Rnd superfamily exporter n=1 Tax=Halogeometricum borinquense (strain ATCC 700274 / DSM 11551 / JCM 10706 / KCTC 4070 / PR3) TaxID=469382 RepID=E4NL20_HALBP|nr:MMPL family transporter [Halogeometricum borinquense]ADQ67172.1 predicted RND superfamily exporter [Halogeometricum borinquense DSM 11551]ELY29720.1 rnd superfamily exporter [Halogeometricum borinquense DSM 11551]